MLARPGDPLRGRQDCAHFVSLFEDGRACGNNLMNATILYHLFVTVLYRSASSRVGPSNHGDRVHANLITNLIIPPLKLKGKLRCL